MKESDLIYFSGRTADPSLVNAFVKAFPDSGAVIELSVVGKANKGIVEKPVEKVKSPVEKASPVAKEVKGILEEKAHFSFASFRVFSKSL